MAAAFESDAPVFLVGATGVGKSAAAMELARAYAERSGAAILAMDAMQVYRGADIGTGKPMAAERAEVPHGGLDLVEFGASFDVGHYLKYASAFLREQRDAGRRVIIVGGTGLYFRALTRGLCEAPQGSDELRAELAALSVAGLRARLGKVDPAMLERIDAANPRRLARAIEVKEATNRSLRDWQEETPEPLVGNYTAFWIQREKAELEARIEARVEAMFAAGWVEEVRGLVGRYSAEAVRKFQGIGYREIADMLTGNGVAPTIAFPNGVWEREMELRGQVRSQVQLGNEGTSKLKRDIFMATRRYAKRQLTWFAREPTLQKVMLTGHQSPLRGRSRPALKASHLTSPPPGNERTLLVGLERPDDSKWDHAESLQELGELVKSAGGEVVETAIQRRPAPTAAYYIGPGKAAELAELCQKGNVGTVIFNDELSPAQSRNLEKVFERKIIDRTQLILDIFAQRAKSKDGKLQIELAQLQYLLPRLTGMWTHLSRQSGGIGMRGPGETQLEVDRRRVTDRIARLSRELDEVRQQRGIQRAGRLRQHWPICSFVGYTNAGKSTLLNKMTNSEVYAADQLFATLDPTTRQFVLPNKQKLLLTDTVGFLKQLPHHLIESFKATLEEVAEADLLLHVVDLSHPLYEQQMAAVQVVLEELNAWGKQMVVIFNKVDRVTNPALIEYALHKHPHSVAISAATGAGLPELFEEIEHRVKSWRLRVKLVIPNHLTALVAELHRVGRVLDVSYQGDKIALTAHVPPQLQGKIKPYRVADDEKAIHH